jgi:L-aminopeptidase/D-esterase-like protein
MAALGAAAAIAVVALLAIDNKEKTGARALTPHAVASETRPLAGDARTRAQAPAAEPSASATGSASGAPVQRGTHGGGRPPPVRATSDEPGKKPPRPNPYASASPPH